MWTLERNDTNEPTYKTEGDSESNSWLPQGRDSEGVWDQRVHTSVFKMDNQQRPIV